MLGEGRVAVTGGCGFVGSALCRRLVAEDASVLVIDDLRLGRPENIGCDGNEVEIAPLDIRDLEMLTARLQDYRPDTVYHLAAIHFIPACEANPVEAIDVNVRGTECVLEACAAVDSVESIVLASSAAVYQPALVAHSEGSSVDPTDIYGLTKLWVEQLGQLFHRKTGIDLGIARLFNVFGPGETNPHLIPAILEQARRRDELGLGNLSTRRDYVFVDDVAEALVALGARCRGRGTLVLNVGSEQDVDGYGLVRMIGEVLGRTLGAQVDETRVRHSDRPLLLSDCSRAHSELPWRARTSLREGLAASASRPLAFGIAIA